MKQKHEEFGSIYEAIIYPLLLVAVMWLVFWAEQLYDFPFYKLGILPRSIEGLKGVIFMPLLHAKRDINHILNNSFPTFILLGTIIYFYREIALKVFIFLWLGTGFLLWIYAKNYGAYHIGMSGLIYGMVGFLFTSGVLRKYLPLQAISLLVVFLYGSLIWGIFPIKASVSWEGHFMGLVVGLILAIVYKRDAIQRPKFQYEIEKEMGIEPPDLEGIWRENQRLQQLYEDEQRRLQNGYFIVYDYKPDTPKTNESNKETNPEV